MAAGLSDPANAVYVLDFGTPEQADEYAGLLPPSFKGVSVKGMKVTVPVGRSEAASAMFFTLVWTSYCLFFGGAVCLGVFSVQVRRHPPVLQVMLPPPHQAPDYSPNAFELQSPINLWPAGTNEDG